MFPSIDCPSYKWIFVGGKGGVGKTTTSCSLAVYLSQRRRNVLLVSTDPASNLGDAFQQHFSYEPQLVKGFNNLWAMNAPEKSMNEEQDEETRSMMNIPGIDEFHSLSSLLDSVENDTYDVVVFDTAPTGHTMRFLQFPSNIQSLMGGFGNVIPNGLFSTVSRALGMENSVNYERMQKQLDIASKRLKNPNECTFICVLLPEFLPLYETERLIQFLADQQIETHMLVVNQIMDVEESKECPICSKRCIQQQKYLKEIYSLYDDFQVLEVPLSEEEIRGTEMVKKFAENFKKL